MKKSSFCERKFRSMLSASTLTLAIIYIMLLSDNIIAGMFIGTAGVEAINAVTPVTGIVSFFSTIISIGTGIIYSREIGAMRKRRADEFFGQGLLLSIVLSAVTAFLLAACRDIYFSTNEITGEVYTLASAYYRWMPLNAILFIMNSFVTKLVYTDGDETSTNLSYAFQIGGNILFSILLVRRHYSGDDHRKCARNSHRMPALLPESQYAAFRLAFLVCRPRAGRAIQHRRRHHLLLLGRHGLRHDRACFHPLRRHGGNNASGDYGPA